MNTPDYFHSDKLFFFAGRPAELALFDDFFRRMDEEFPDVSAKVQKTQISFYGKHLFAMASLPRKKSERGILVSVGLPYRPASPRVAAAAEPYPGRWTVHVPVREASEMDGELTGWLREAYDFSERK